MGSAQHEFDILAYQGAEYEDVGIDQAEEFTEYQFDILRSVMRTTKEGIKTQMYLGANPGGVGHGWLKRKFIESTDPEYKFIPAKVYDNPVLMKTDPDYVEELKKLPTELRRAYLEGDWNVFAGQVFDEWRYDKHVVETFEYPLESCRKIISYDWGYNAPGCAVWLAYTPDMRIYVYRELYQNLKKPEEWALEIKELSQNEKIEYIVLPHDCFSSDKGEETIATIFSRITGLLVVPAKTLVANARKNRLAITKQYLSDAPDGKPYLQVHKSCLNLIRTLPELVYSKTNPEDVDTEGEDHAYDALSIGLMTKSISSDKEFKDSWIKTRTKSEVEGLNVRRFATICFDKDGTEDFVGIVRNYVDDMGKWNVEAMKIKFDVKELINYLFILHDQNFEKIGVNEDFYIESLKQFVDEESVKRSKFPVVVSIKQNKSEKEAKIRSLIPRYASGMIFHIENECLDLEYELDIFPKGFNNTLAACAMQLDIAEAPLSPYQEFAMKYQREQKKDFVKSNFGL
jgi:predicted transport protein